MQVMLPLCMVFRVLLLDLQMQMLWLCVYNMQEILIVSSFKSYTLSHIDLFSSVLCQHTSAMELCNASWAAVAGLARDGTCEARGMGLGSLWQQHVLDCLLLSGIHLLTLGAWLYQCCAVIVLHVPLALLHFRCRWCMGTWMIPRTKKSSAV